MPVRALTEQAALTVDTLTLFPRSWGHDAASLSLFQSGTVVMLNSPHATPSYFGDLWTVDKFRACADGACNRLYDRAPDALAPHVIVGDFDSSRRDVLKHYEEKGCAVVKRTSQARSYVRACMHAPS